MSQQIIAYFRKHKQIIEENFELSQNPNDIEAIHNMRLSIKRLRVVARLADMISFETFDRKSSLKEINGLFKRAGRLRDVQVTRLLMEELGREELNPVILTFRERELKFRTKYETAMQEFDEESLERFDKKLAGTFKGKSETESFETGLLLLTDLETEIYELFHGSTLEKRLHNVRTRLKDINYLNNIFDEALPVQDHLNISVDRLRELGEIAGSWHDFLNLELKLGKYIGKNPSETESLQAVLSDLKKKKQDLHQEYTCILINEMKI
jgi:CHAD domain-containing protein